MRLLGRAARRCPGRWRVTATLGRGLALQALLERVHQADDIVGPFFGFGRLDRLAGGLALDQRLQRILVLVLELAGIEMSGLCL